MKRSSRDFPEFSVSRRGGRSPSSKASGTTWSPETSRASNSCELNETPQTLLINLHVRVGDRLQVGVFGGGGGGADWNVGDSATLVQFFSPTTIMWLDTARGTQTVLQ